MTKRWVLGLLAGAGLVAAGCSSSPTPHATSSTTTSSPLSNPTTTTNQSSATTTSTTGAAVAGCSGLTASAGQSEGAAGTITGSIILAESGSAHCTFDGYPTMALFGSGGAGIAVTMVDGLSVDISTPANAAPSSVTLTPSTHLEFTYQYSDVPSGTETSCPSSSTVSVTAPGQTTGTPPISLALAPCDNGTIRVSPLYVAS